MSDTMCSLGLAMHMALYRQGRNMDKQSLILNIVLRRMSQHLEPLPWAVKGDKVENSLDRSMLVRLEHAQDCSRWQTSNVNHSMLE